LSGFGDWGAGSDLLVLTSAGSSLRFYSPRMNGRLNGTRGALKHLVVLTCIAHWALPAYATARVADDSQPYVISTNVNLVILPVTVTDHEHQFVSGLDASQFRVYEEGRLQMLSLFKAEDIPVTVGLVVDHSGSMDPRKTDVIEGAAAFVKASNSQDEEFVVNFNDEVLLGLPPNVPFTSDLEDLTTALSAASAMGGTALYDALAVALDHLRDAQKEKKALILITDGEDNASRHSFAQVLGMAQARNVLIYSVGLFDNRRLNRGAQEFYKPVIDEDKRMLTRLAQETGGAAYFRRDSIDVTQVCQQIASDIRHQYTLGYNPKADDRGGYRKLRVRLVRSDQGKFAVRTRTGYLFPAKLH